MTPRLLHVADGAAVIASFFRQWVLRLKSRRSFQVQPMTRRNKRSGLHTAVVCIGQYIY